MHMICIEWIDEFNIGINEIDEQHKQLVAFMNRICSALNEGQETQIIEEVLMEMQNYANSHFTLEENYFDEFHYEKAKEHADSHQEFRDKMNSLIEDLKRDRESVSIDTISFLGKWFIGHTQTYDREYVELFHEHGIN